MLQYRCSVPARITSTQRKAGSPFAERQQLGRGVKWNAAHNSCQVGAELGIPGLLMFVGNDAAAFVALRRSSRRVGVARVGSRP